MDVGQLSLILGLLALEFLAILMAFLRGQWSPIVSTVSCLGVAALIVLAFCFWDWRFGLGVLAGAAVFLLVFGRGIARIAQRILR